MEFIALEVVTCDQFKLKEVLHNITAGITDTVNCIG